jgi:hypothetical protein
VVYVFVMCDDDELRRCWFGSGIIFQASYSITTRGGCDAGKDRQVGEGDGGVARVGDVTQIGSVRPSGLTAFRSTGHGVCECVSVSVCGCV